MSEPGFFKPPQPITIGEIAALTGAVAADPSLSARRIEGIASLERAGPKEATYCEGRRFRPLLAATKAGACFVSQDLAAAVPAPVAALVTDAPHRAFAVLAAHLYPDALKPAGIEAAGAVSPAAHVASTARLEEGVSVDPGAVIAAGAEIGRGTLIGAGSVIGPGVRIGRNGSISANVTIGHALIGDRVIIHPGACIGQDGFGYIPGPKGHMKIPQIGRVIIQDDVEIGANTTIDRGSHRDTVVGEGTKIDNLVQIAHNVVIGRHCLIAGQVGISGSVTIGDFVMLGGNAGIRDHVTIGSGARIAAMAAIHGNIPAGETWGGYPAQEINEYLRQLKAYYKLVRQPPISAGGARREDAPDGQ